MLLLFFLQNLAICYCSSAQPIETSVSLWIDIYHSILWLLRPCTYDLRIWFYDLHIRLWVQSSSHLPLRCFFYRARVETSYSLSVSWTPCSWSSIKPNKWTEVLYQSMHTRPIIKNSVFPFVVESFKPLAITCWKYNHINWYTRYMAFVWPLDVTEIIF